MWTPFGALDPLFLLPVGSEGRYTPQCYYSIKNEEKQEVENLCDKLMRKASTLKLNNIGFFIAYK